MSLDCNSCNNTNLKHENDICAKRLKEDGSYLVVDQGEMLLDIEEARLELQKQILSLLEKVCLLWEIVRRSVIFIFPVLAGMFICLLSSQFLPKDLAPWTSALTFTLTLGLVFINLEPLNEAIAAFLEHEMYVPDMKTEKQPEETNDATGADVVGTETSKPDGESSPATEFELD